MRRMSGFSLMEMMVVLLITAIVAAASAPMVNKKLMHDQAESGSPWLYVGTDNSIVYNVKGSEEQTVSIGGVNDTDTYPALYLANTGKSGLYIDKGGETQSHILLRDNTSKMDDPMEIRYESSSIYLTDKLNQNASNSVVIGGGKAFAGERAVTMGANASAGAGGVAIGGPTTGSEPKSVVAGQNAIAIGSGANSMGIAIGSGANVNNGRSIAIGREAQASAETWGSIAIGTKTEATKEDSIAIGDQASAAYKNSIAIGATVSTTQEKQIVLGTSLHTVYIPGNLVVGGYSILGYEPGKYAHIRMYQQNTTNTKLAKIRYNGVGNNLELGSDYDNLIPGFKSDRRLKNVGKAFVGGLEDVKKLEVFNYTFKKDTTKTPHVGVMAQDLEKIFPNAVFKGDDGFLRIRMEDMFYAVVNAIKELDSKFEALRNNEIKTLQKQVADLEKQNKELLKRIEKIEKNLK